jgi:iron complex outermembrane receptor protein
MASRAKLSGLLVSAALGSMLCPHGAAVAQDQPAGLPEQQATQDAGGLEDIVVTARKRAESLQDVPVAVSAFTGAQLEQQGTRTVLDIARTVPSLSATTSQNSSGTVQFSLRGQAAGGVILTVDQAVGIYADGGYIPRPYGLAAGFVDIQSVEVLKGPQGTLYGRNTTGGAINIISRGPDFEGIHGYIYGELGNHKNRRVNGAINIPVVADMLTARFAFQDWQREGYGRSRITGQDMGGDRNQQFARGMVRFEPSTSVRIDFKADWTRIRENGLLTTARFYVPSAASNYQAAIELGLDPTLPASLATAQAAIQNIAALGNSDLFTSDTANKLHEDTDTHSFVLNASFDLTDNVQLRSITSYRNLEEDRETELDGTRFHLLENVDAVPSSFPSKFGLPERPWVEDRLWTQELNLSGNLLDGRFNFLVGAFYSNEKGNDRTQNDFRLNQFFAQNAAPLRNFVININEGIDVSNKSSALYTQNDFKITRTLTATAGFRYTWETRGMTSALRRFDPVNNLWRCGHPALAGRITADPTECYVKLPENKSSGTSYMASLNWKPSEDSLLYARTAKGFRGGGFQLLIPTAPNFGAEVAKDIEVGAKAEFFDRRLRANLAVYRTKYTNKQETQIVAVPIQGTATITTNAASATIKGFEAELVARPVDILTLRGTVSHLHGRYDDYSGALRYTGGAFGDAAGERFAVPRWQYSLQARMDLPVADDLLGLQVDWSFIAGAKPTARNVDPALPAALTNDFVGDLYGRGGRASLGLLNLRADYEVRRLGVTVSAFASNVLNKKYQVAAIPQTNVGGVATGVTGEPRMIGFGIRKSFGAE